MAEATAMARAARMRVERCGSVVAETETGRLWAWEIEGPGRLKKDAWPSTSGGRLLCQFPGYRRLDSLAIAACTWSCRSRRGP